MLSLAFLERWHQPHAMVLATQTQWTTTRWPPSISLLWSLKPQHPHSCPLLSQPSRITIKTGTAGGLCRHCCKGALLGLAGPGRDSLGLAKAPGKPQAVVHIHLFPSSSFLGADTFSHKGQGIWQEYTTAALDGHYAIVSPHSSLRGTTKGQDNL